MWDSAVWNPLKVASLETEQPEVPTGGTVKSRVFFLIGIMLSLGVVAIAQNTPDSGFVNNSFASDLQTLDTHSYAALPYHQGFVPPPNAPGESSSRKHALSATQDGTSTGQALTTTQRPCEEPARLFSPRDYSGPLSRLGAWFSRKPEISTVPARKKSGKNVCELDNGEKFMLFAKTTFEPVTFMGAGVSAGYSQWQNDDREWGQGAAGYGKRYAAAFTDRITRNFFRKFFYPVIFQQDPRYFRQGHGTTKQRFGHAVAHTFVARSDSGRPMLNYSLWTGTVSTVAVENLYHPGEDRGFSSAARRTGVSIGTSMGFDILREFWPEVVRKLHLPFRERQVVPATP